MQHYDAGQYILIALANAMGKDKLSFDQRIQEMSDIFLKEDQSHIVPIAKEIIATHQVESPMLFLKAAHALVDYCQDNPSGFWMSLDATASGIQILSVLSCCNQTAKSVNVVSTDKREDVYQFGADYMNRLMSTDKFTKSILKKPIMTTFYGSKKQPEAIFGKDTPELDAYYAFLNEQLTGAIEVRDDIQSCWNKTTTAHQWVLPDGHTAFIPVKEAEDKKIEIDELEHRSFTHRAYIVRPATYGISLAANVTHSIDGMIVREMYRRMSSTRQREARDLAVKYVGTSISIPDYSQTATYRTVDEYLDMSHEQIIKLTEYERKVMVTVLFQFALTSKGDLVSIHDCFGSRPKSMNSVRTHYNTILFQIACSDLLQSILRQITNDPTLKYKKIGTLNPYDVLNTEYALS
jgi:hypothetical protein